MKWPLGRNGKAEKAESVYGNDKYIDGKKQQHKSKKPPDTPFRQQKLKAWVPILTSKTVLPAFFAIGTVLAPIGGVMLQMSAKVSEMKIDYSNCPQLASDHWKVMPEGRLTSQFKSKNPVPIPRWRRQLNQSVLYTDSMVFVNNTAKCFLQFDIVEDMEPPVLLYYQLDNFYQNHRYYVKSFDILQMAGHARTLDEVTHNDCNKLRYNNATGKPYYPCGYIANSIFNDTFQKPKLLVSPAGKANETVTYEMSKRGIAWSSERNLYRKTAYKPGQVEPPPHWARRWNYTKSLPDLSQDEAFQNWMRAAALSTFSKLAMRNDQDTMRKGQYEIEIWDEYNTTLYDGTKSILISTSTIMGGRNTFLGISFIVVASLCVLLGMVLTIASMAKPRKLGDDSFLSWNRYDARKFQIPARNASTTEQPDTTKQLS